MSFFRSLFSSTDPEADSIIVCGVGASVVMWGIGVGLAVHDPATFSLLTFAGAQGTLIAAIAGGKRWRDGVQAPQQGGS